MNRAWVLFGMIVIGGMLLVPPAEVILFDTSSAAADLQRDLDRGSETYERSDHTSTTVVYRPVWSELPEEINNREVEGSEFATGRLLLQIGVVVVVCGGGGLLVDRSDSSESG